MQEMNIKIVKQKISSSHISISENLGKNFEIRMECRAKMKPAKREEDKSILLNFELNMSTKDEEMKIKFISDFIFEFDQQPDDYDMIAEQKLVPMAREALLCSLDEMLVVMGYPKMKLVEKIS